MKIYLGNCHSTLDSYTPELEAALTVAHENYWFSQEFKLGIWDGRTHFLKISSLKFPTGLLHIVTDYCEAHDQPYEIIDNRAKPLYVLGEMRPDMLQGIILRPYQEEAIVAALAMERGCLEMATGSGKTEVAAALIKLLGLRTLFLVHTKDLLRQTRKRFEERLGTKIGAVGDGVDEHQQQVVVAMIQTVYGWLKKNEKTTKLWLQQFQVVFLDECHHASAASWYRLGLLTTSAYFRFGLSGTVLRRDNLSNAKMLAVCGAPIYNLPARQLIEQGYLCDIKIVMIDNPETVTGANWQQVYEAGVVQSLDRNRLIVDIAEREFRAGKRVMVLVRMIEHGHILQRMLVNHRHIKAVFLSGSTHSEDRGRALVDFRDGAPFIIIASVIFDEGVDIPSINVLVVAAGGKSEVRAIQRAGRGLRKKQDASSLTVYDFMDSSRWLSQHSLKRLSVYRKEKFTGGDYEKS